MSAQADPAQRVAIGISFGNSYSSIAFTSGEGRAQVIANEDGGMLLAPRPGSPPLLIYPQIARSLPLCLTLKERNSTVDRPRASSSAMRRTQSPTSATFSDKSRQPDQPSMSDETDALKLQIDRPLAMPPVGSPHTA
ncbi:hypothetical protein IG631_21611 [Alternaria alternata]|nr:hypothetical protein IG631_21611 [Alternaria alternata]